MGDKLVTALAGLLFMVLVVGTIWGFGYLRYRECRAHGFSVFYCVTR